MSVRRPVLASLVAVTVLGGAATSLHAQTLGDLARQEEERRQANPGATKTITNKDLPPVPRGSSAPAPAASAAPKTDTTSKPGEPTAAAKADTEKGAAKAGAETGKDTDKGVVKDEKYWREGLKTLNDQLARDEIYADALQSRISAFNADFVNRDDPAQRAKIANDRQRSIDELSRLKTAIQDGKKAIDDFQEEARRAGVPPGWLR